MTPLGAIVRGAIAGAVGTLAMDLVWYARYRKDGGEDSFTDWEFATDVEGYENASAPAKVGKRVIEGLFDTELPPDTAAPMTNVVHWATGMGWGVFHGVRASSFGSGLIGSGIKTGTTAFGTSYGVLAPAGLYKPIWEYDWKTLWDDYSAHLAFGVGTAVTYWLLGGTRD